MKPYTYIIIILSFAYAIVRYHVLGDIAWEHFPLFVTNKALSLSGLIFLGMSLVQREKKDRKSLGQLGAALIGMHVLISYLILNKQYFMDFFQYTGIMTFQAEMAMLAGVIGFMFMGALLMASPKSNAPEGHATSLRLGWGRAILILAAVHVAFMGYGSWLTPREWPGYLPPIKGLSFLIAIVFLVRRRKTTPE